MKKREVLKGLSIEELEERNEFSSAGCSDPTPCCCFGEPCSPSGGETQQ